MNFTLQHTSKNSRARAGKLSTPHGEIETPIFMPVGTLGSVKGIFHKELKEDSQAQIILGNTYHLYLRPGLEILEKAGGLHKFSAWDRPMLTDSGGFQVFSLSGIRKITEEGVRFSSHIDGSKHLFTPESVMDTQRIIGADIMMAFDECPPSTAERDYAKKSLDLTSRWLERCWKQFSETECPYGHSQMLFPIVQGTVFPDLRREACREVMKYPAEGYAIGGLAVGEPAPVMYEMIEVCTDVLPTDRPRYLMGVGTPVNILEAIERGVDMFDCVMPTRNGRNGMIFTREGIINIKNAKWADDFSPLDPFGTSFVDSTYSKAYVRHLTIAGEMLAAEICSLHNISFYLWLVKEARTQIIAGDFEYWKKEMVEKLSRRL
ncbi:MAG: tRNA guanosine(34) transglycosylase Tgt [Rikenellaceae bacterium]